MNLFAELKRRNVIRMAGLYLVGAWLMIQVAETLLPIFHTPEWVLQTLVLLLALGFLPALVVSWLFELTPDGLKRDSDVSRAQSIASQTGRRMDRLLLIGLIAVVALVGADRFWPREAAVETSVSADAATSSAASDGPIAPRASAAIGAPPPKSIAVLPFVNMSADADNEYFSDGISEEILNALAKVSDLKVAGRTSSFYFKGKNESLSMIGSTLGVANVLEGSVRKQGDKVRITAQLIQVSDGYHLWSETYDGELADVFELQEHIARSITNELKVILSSEQQGQLVNAGTRNTEAYALYLQATGTFNRRDGARFDEAIAQLERAIALDPTFARAWSRMATLQAVRFNYSAQEAAIKEGAVEQAARAAIALDPKLAEPHAALALSYLLQRRYREQRIEILLALQIDPNDVTANFWQGVLWLTTGYREAAKQALDRALEIDPLLPNALLWRSRIHVADGELEIASQQLQRAKEGGHGFVGLGTSWLDLARGNRQSAIEELTSGLAYFSQDFPSGAGQSFALSCLGDEAAKVESQELIDDYLADRPKVLAGIVPYVLIRSGEVARGFALAQASPTNNESLLMADLFSGLQPALLSAPAFTEYVREVGLAAYWDEFGPPDDCRPNDAGDYVCE